MDHKVFSSCLQTFKSRPAASEADYLRCLCGEGQMDWACQRVASTQSPDSVSITSEHDYNRSYIVSSSVCAIFIVLCVVLVVMRILRSRWAPAGNSETAEVATTPPSPQEPPSYESVVGPSPPPYWSVQALQAPPLYEEVCAASKREEPEVVVVAT